MKVTRDLVIDILKKYRCLGLHEFGNYSQRTTEEFRYGRRLMLRDDSLQEIQITVDWISQFAKRKTINRGCTSYDLKHDMEHINRLYVTNGQFIVAALLAGFDIKECSPNVSLNVSGQDLRKRGVR